MHTNRFSITKQGNQEVIDKAIDNDIDNAISKPTSNEVIDEAIDKYDSDKNTTYASAIKPFARSEYAYAF